jgi:hypothetical protein
MNKVEQLRLGRDRDQLARYLSRACDLLATMAGHVEASACTCNTPHEPGCMGIEYAKPARRFLRRVRG